MRSPITQNGRSKPITTSRVAELTTVSTMRFSGISADGTSSRGIADHQAGAAGVEGEASGCHGIRPGGGPGEAAERVEVQPLDAASGVGRLVGRQFDQQPVDRKSGV